MQAKDLKAEITALEIRLQHLHLLLDQSIKDNEVLAKTKVIYHDLRLGTERLQLLKASVEIDSKADGSEVI
jgi:hypothetical protein